MLPYVGTKIVMGLPMTRLEYNDLRGWDLPEDENGDDEGYLVEYQDGGTPNHPDYQGYISWSPKDVFEKAYVAINSTNEEQPHQLRVLAEQAQLTDKIDKLTAFIANEEKFTQLSPEERSLLQIQLVQMKAYQSTLQVRIMGFYI